MHKPSEAIWKHCVQQEKACTCVAASATVGQGIKAITAAHSAAANVCSRLRHMARFLSPGKGMLTVPVPAQEVQQCQQAL